MSSSEAEPDRGWFVRILDNSGGAEEGIVEEVKDFQDLAHANAYARAYVRDSIERCRRGGAVGREVLEAWFSFGEDAMVVEAGDDGWKSASELKILQHRQQPRWSGTGARSIPAALLKTMSRSSSDDHRPAQTSCRGSVAWRGCSVPRPGALGSSAPATRTSG